MRIVLVLFILFSTFIHAQQSNSAPKRDLFQQQLQNATDDQKVNLYVTISRVFRDSVIGVGLTYLDSGLPFVRSMNRPDALGEILANKAFMHLNLYDYKQSIDCAVEALKIGNELHNQKILSSTYNVLGIYYLRRASLDKSHDYLLRALKIRRQLGDIKDISATTNNIGLVFLQLKNYSQALSYFEQSAELKKQLKDLKALIRSLGNIALCYKEMGEYQKAITVLDSATNYTRNRPNWRGNSILYIIWGDILLMQGDAKNAMIKYQAALNEYNYLAVKKGSGSVDMFISFSRYYVKTNNLQKAVLYLDTALMVAKNSKLIGTLPKIYEEFSSNYAKLGDYKRAYEYKKLFSQSKDSLDSVEKNKVIAEMQALYNVEEIERELREKEAQLNLAYGIGSGIFGIALVLTWMFFQKRKINMALQNKNSEIELQKEQLSIVNAALSDSEARTKEYAEELKEIIAMKDKFFSIIAHDLKSPFNGFLGLCELLKFHVDEFNPEETKQMANQLYDMAKVQYQLLENLLAWGNMQRGKMPFVPEFFNSKENIKSLLEFLKPMADEKNIQIKVDIDENCKIYADRNMYETVLRNLIANAIKFSYRGSIVSVKISGSLDECAVVVSDQGVGIEQERIGELFRIDKNVSTNGTESEKGTGLGLILCKELIDKHNGSISVSSELMKGTTITVKLPMIAVAS